MDIGPRPLVCSFLGCKQSMIDARRYDRRTIPPKKKKVTPSLVEPNISLSRSETLLTLDGRKNFLISFTCTVRVLCVNCATGITTFRLRISILRCGPLFLFSPFSCLNQFPGLIQSNPFYKNNGNSEPQSIVSVRNWTKTLSSQIS